MSDKKKVVGKRHGPGLKPGLNEADTVSTVGSMKGAAAFGVMNGQGRHGKFASDPNVGHRRRYRGGRGD